MAVEHIYLSHGNTIDLILKADEVAQDLSSVTKITATFDDTTIESTKNETGSIKWAVSGYDIGEIRLDMGAQSIDAGSYEVPIVVYDPSNTDGIVWGTVNITVNAEVEAS